MTATTTPTTIPTTETTERSHPVRRATVVSGAVATIAVTAAAAGADVAGVPFAIDGEAIPVAGFTQMTVIGAVLGGLVAAACDRWTASPRRVFMVTAVVLTALSCIPAVALPPDTATQLVLVGIHVLAAAIIIPALARQLRARDDLRPMQGDD